MIKGELEDIYREKNARLGNVAKETKIIGSTQADLHSHHSIFFLGSKKIEFQKQ